jgi:hypothetical protein
MNKKVLVDDKRKWRIFHHKMISMDDGDKNNLSLEIKTGMCLILITLFTDCMIYPWSRSPSAT